jgi:hypothetical protein
MSLTWSNGTLYLQCVTMIYHQIYHRITILQTFINELIIEVIIFVYLTLHIFRAVPLYMSFYYQLLHNNYFYSNMFRLPIVAIIRESLFTDVRCASLSKATP